MESKQQEDIGFLVKLIHDHLERKANKKFAALGLTQAQGRFLAYLHTRNGIKTSQKDIEEQFGISHPTTVGIIKRLEKKGFITTEVDTDDKRMKRITLAQQEASFHKKVKAFQDQLESELLRDFTEAQGKELRRFLTMLYRNIT
jgi:DNA-binding MarR family transcriptional regulator